jgi:primosomal protein N' (replication factor Y)
VSPPGDGAAEPPVPDPGAPVRVAVAVPIPLPGPLTYRAPDSLAAWLRPGQRVRVRVGRRSATGVVWQLDPPPLAAGVELRPIERLLDLEPVLPPDLLELARFASDYYLAPLGEVVAGMLPQDLPPWGDRSVAPTPGGALRPPRDELDERLREALLAAGRIRLSELRSLVADPRLGERVETWIAEKRLVDLGADGSGRRYVAAVQLAPGEAAELRARCGRSPAARAVVDWLGSLGRPATLRELRAETGAGDAVVRRLVRLGVLHSFRQAERRGVERHLMRPAAPAEPVRLLPDQAAALEAITHAIGQGGYRRFLLHGVTGSGKTEVYLRAAEAVLEAGRSAILMVPEIALVPAAARAAADRFGDRLAVLHSGLAGGERSEEWERIRSGEARVVVGPRSALFAPVRDLGLVVVDEEQDSAYKQESSPRYHGRDLALVRCRQAGAVAILASATPSLEARAAAAARLPADPVAVPEPARSDAAERMVLLRLTERVGSARLPEGILVDLRTEPRIGRPGDVLFSARLLDELRATLAAGDQAILLRNRRGYAPLLLCRACGEEFRCEACGLPRTVHRREGRLVCHWCGSSRPMPSACPSCGREALEPIGAGTERVEEELAALLPGVAIGVLDRDATRRVGSAAAILERFRSGETRILVGTQMLSKGHHFPGVALTAVLSADALLGFPDFRAVEKTYALLTQLAGRAGRGERPGRVVLQTYHPEHYAIQAALRHDDAAFAEMELRFRRAFDYPPFSRMVLLLVRDRDRERGLDRLREISRRIERSAPGLRRTGPAPAPLERLKGEWRFQLVVRGRRGGEVRAAVAAATEGLADASLVVDVDPQQLL